MAPPFTPLFINGQWRSASTNETFNVLNPFSRDVVGTSASATGKDCKDAIEAASSAFLTWERTSLSERSAIFLKAADLFATDRYKEKVFGAADETAATDYWSGFQLVAAGRLIRGAVEAAKQLKRETRPTTFPGGEVIVERRPHGVVFAIAPWNAAVVLAARAVVIPLLCGNTVVLKSSEASPKSNAIIVEALQEAGLPTGVLNLISMPRESAPALIAETIAHPAVRKINFTGSDRVGKILAMEAAKYLKPCVLELGGKAPAVVLNDADIDEASRAIVSGAMLHSGQICMSTERVIIQRGISQDLISRITSICKTTLKAGDPKSDSSANLSALFSPGLAENVLSLIVEAKSAGAEVLLGDLKVEGGVIQPHLLNGVKPNMTLWQRESFGPVIVFAVVDSVDEAVDLANDSDYSLMASVWSKDGDVAIDTARRIRAGCCAINGTTITSEPTAPLFGMGGATGYGKFDIDNFTDKRAIVVYPSDPKREYPLTG